MGPLTLDAGALIAADRGDRRFWAFWKQALASRKYVPAGALAQAWRGPRSARIALLLAACEVIDLDEAGARAAGELCGRAGTADVVDASVVLTAAAVGGMILTSDPGDLERLRGHTTGHHLQVVDIGALR